MSDDIISGICGIIQDGYGDATQTVLDRQVAEKIHEYMLSRGWAAPHMVSAIVEAAGGEVRVPERMLTDPPKDLELIRWQSPSDFTIVIATRNMHRLHPTGDRHVLSTRKAE